MSFNNNGFNTIILSIDDIWGYLAYGTGDVSDNDSSLETEVDRIDSPESVISTNYFDLTFTLSETEGNGNVITEWGLAKADIGYISSTDNYVPIDKNSDIYLDIYIRTYLINLSVV
jgi:hypothetical protein